MRAPKFGSPQNSDVFVDWLVEYDERDAEFFAGQGPAPCNAKSSAARVSLGARP